MTPILETIEQGLLEPPSGMKWPAMKQLQRCLNDRRGAGICLGEALDVRKEIASPSNNESHSPDEEPEGQPISKIKVSIGNSRHKMARGEEALYLKSAKPRS